MSPFALQARKNGYVTVKGMSMVTIHICMKNRVRNNEQLIKWFALASIAAASRSDFVWLVNANVDSMARTVCKV